MIKHELDSIHCEHDGMRLVLLKDGKTKFFKRKAAVSHNPKESCPVCGSTVERIEVKTSAGRYIGDQFYCGSCDSKVGKFTEAKSWVVMELDGVRAYCNGKEVVMTKKDLYP